MKTNYFLLFLSISILNFSCNSDDDDLSNESENLILGNWYITNKIVNGKTIPYNDHEECGKDYIEFKNDGSIWLINISECEKDFEKLGNYSLENNVLKIEGKIVEILKLDSKNFTTKIEYDYDEDGKIDEVIENYER